MHILCVGPTDTGRPTVIFESGLGGDAGQWSDVIHELDGSTRTCAYDRAGVGNSEPATVGRTTEDQVADLRALLAAAKVAPPYILVGYSLGGWNVMVHADAYPADVVGAVMVDVRPPAASQQWLKALPAASATESEAIKMAREESTTFDTDPTLNPEGLRLGDSAAQALATKGFGDKPLIVLAAADTVGGHRWLRAGARHDTRQDLVGPPGRARVALDPGSPGQGRERDPRDAVRACGRDRRCDPGGPRRLRQAARWPEPVRMGESGPAFARYTGAQPGGAAGRSEEVD